MNYSELKTKIQEWMHRENDVASAAQLDTFILLFESRANRKLRTAEMETNASGTTSATALTLPADFLEMRSVKTGTRTLEYVTPSALLDHNHTVATVYTITGSTLKTNANCTVDYTYYKQIPALSASTTTNWLLSAHPDAYLFGTLAESAVYTVNNEQAALFSGLRDGLFDAIQQADKRKRWSGAPLRLSPTNKHIV